MKYKEAISLVIDNVIEKAEMLSAFDEWKIISNHPLISELKFRITPSEFSEEISDLLKIGKFFVKIQLDPSEDEPILNHYGLKELNGKKEDFIIGVKIRNKEYINSLQAKVRLETMLLTIIENYETK